MVTIDIPGRHKLEINTVLFDFNGTLALDGHFVKGVAPRLEQLSRLCTVIVLTADTFGTAAAACEPLGIAVRTFPKGRASDAKRSIAEEVEGGVAAFGNGFNDAAMLMAADFACAVIGGEGACGAVLGHADVVVCSINDGIDLLLRTDRLRATLRA